MAQFNNPQVLGLNVVILELAARCSRIVISNGIFTIPGQAAFDAVPAIANESKRNHLRFENRQVRSEPFSPFS